MRELSYKRKTSLYKNLQHICSCLNEWLIFYCYSSHIAKTPTAAGINWKNETNHWKSVCYCELRTRNKCVNDSIKNRIPLRNQSKSDHFDCYNKVLCIPFHFNIYLSFIQILNGRKLNHFLFRDEKNDALKKLYMDFNGFLCPLCRHLRLKIIRTFGTQIYHKTYDSYRQVSHFHAPVWICRQEC